MVFEWEKMKSFEENTNKKSYKCWEITHVGLPWSLHTFLEKFLYRMLVKFKQNRLIQTTRNFELFDQKMGFFKPFWTKSWRHFGVKWYLRCLEVNFNIMKCLKFCHNLFIVFYSTAKLHRLTSFWAYFPEFMESWGCHFEGTLLKVFCIVNPYVTI